MVRITLTQLKNDMETMLRNAGMSPDNAAVMADVYMRATLRGVGHHDVHDLPGRVKSLRSGKIRTNPEISQISAFNAMERYNGDNGPGELCSMFIMDRAMKLADEYGIALCTIQNSNHFLSAAPYVEVAAEKGYLGLIYTRTNPVMNSLGTAGKVIGNSPIGFAVNTDSEDGIMLDICLAYASFGKFKELADKGEKIPSYWGTDADGKPTTDPADIMNGGIAATIGEHKGFGLSLLTEILTGVLSGGQVIDEKQSDTSVGPGVYSQTAIVIKTDGLMPAETFTARTTDVVNRMKAISPGIHIPGQTSFEKRRRMEKDGFVELAPALAAILNDMLKE